MDTVVLIPARYASSRFPGKPLQTLRGPDGEKTLIERSWQAATAAKGVDAVYVATDDERIADAAKAFGADVVVTSESCANGTERCADALDRLDLNPRLVVNLQGDAPLTPPHFVEALIEAMADVSHEAAVATPVLACDAETYQNFREDRLHGKVGGTTAVFGASRRALYFSKEVVPYKADGSFDPSEPDVFHHVGLYAYTPAALKAYMSATPGPLETTEGLEQLRFLENGVPIQCVEVPAGDHMFWELNNPEDVARIEAILNKT
ncbi:MAG: manno-octulosonate cytidylyltransferase [Pseudomonadota bacterium]